MQPRREAHPCDCYTISTIQAQKTKTNTVENPKNTQKTWTPGTCIRVQTLAISECTYITLHYITLHYITLHYVTLRYVTLQYSTVQYSTLHYNTFFALHYITLHYITLHTWHVRIPAATLSVSFPQRQKGLPSGLQAGQSALQKYWPRLYMCTY